MKLDMFEDDIPESELEMKWEVSEVVKDEKGNTLSFITTPIGWIEPKHKKTLPW